MSTCLIGEKLNYSLSKEIHNSMGDLTYDLVELNKDDIEKFIKSKKYVGFNVTIPYKEKIIEYLDGLDAISKEVGAVNTVVLKGDKYYGYNTDVYGFKKLLEINNINPKNKTILILGSGGAAKACKYVIDKLGGDTYMVSRTGEINYQNAYEIDANIVVNATPIGNVNHMGSMLDLDKFFNLEAVIDLVYNPLRSKLLQDASKLSIKHINGLSMLVYQAIESNSLFFDKDKYDQADFLITKLSNELENIVFIGMSGCGKSTIAKIVANKLGYEFVDIDEEIEKTYGLITDIFTKYGEKYFRQLEKEFIKKYSLKHGMVISTGGGAILDEENQLYLKSNGKIVLISRDIDKLDLTNRPLIKDFDSAKELYNKRHEIYFANADIIVDNNDTIDNAVNKVLKQL